MLSTTTSTITLLSFLLPAFASPQPTSSLSPQPTSSGTGASPIVLPLHHQNTQQYSPDIEARRSWQADQREGLLAKYAAYLAPDDAELHARSTAHRRSSSEHNNGKRAVANVTLADIGVDASYAAQVSIGTPAQQFLLIMDTGSADLWVAGDNCESSTCLATTRFNSQASSSYQSDGEPFGITYGSGTANGVIGLDTVQMGGFTVNSQGLAVVNSTTANLITSPISGLMGLGFKALAQTRATPFWQTVATSGNWDQQVMGFYMKRYRGTRGVQAVEAEGGTFMMGGLDTSKYTGDVNYIDIPSSNLAFWRIALQGMTVGGSSVDVGTPQVAIDTGTTLVGVPSSVAQAIYAQIPNSQPMSASSGYAGYYQYPCSQSVNITLQFGGLSYSINDADFNLGAFSQQDTSMCTGAFFEMNLSSQSTIQWIVGATFLKNVYTAFRYSPPAVGFAQLVEGGGSISDGTSPDVSTNTGGSTSAASRRFGVSAGVGLALMMVPALLAVLVC